MIGIIDYDMGNIGSIANMIGRLQGNCTIVTSAEQINYCEKLVLPGVGAFDTAIRNLHQKDLWNGLNSFALEYKKPVLGICLGMQIMCKQSEEGNETGLSWFDTVVRRFDFSSDDKNNSLRIPHMGWNIVKPVDPLFPLYKDSEEELRFYFVHSYAVDAEAGGFVKGTTNYGYSFASVVGNENLMGFQCHPEKSHKYGMNIFKNFIEL